MNFEPKELDNVFYELEHDFMIYEGELTHLLDVITTNQHFSSLLDIVEVTTYI